MGIVDLICLGGFVLVVVLFSLCYCGLDLMDLFLCSSL